jgi:hypothetical protein
MGKDAAVMFERFAKEHAAGYSPLYERIAKAISSDRILLDAMEYAPESQRQPTLLLAALHDVALDHQDDAFARWYPTVTGGEVPPENFATELHEFYVRHKTAIIKSMASRATQTNEVGRSAALLPARARPPHVAGQPLAIVELGASAGLKLNFDRYRIDYGTIRLGPSDSPVQLECDLRGTSLSAGVTAPEVVGRVGIDLYPIDVSDDSAVRWLTACVYPDLEIRHARLKAAIQVARKFPVPVLEGDLVEAAPALIKSAPGSAHVCVFHTWVAHYLDNDELGALREMIETAAKHRDLTWIAAEPPRTLHELGVDVEDERSADATVLSMSRFVSGKRTDKVIARMHPHGKWMEWIGTRSTLST